MLPNFLVGRGMPGEAFFNSFYPIIIAVCAGIFFGFRHYFKGVQCPRLGDLTGKIVIITGANSGIGLELTKSLAAAGAKIIMACRNKSQTEHVISDIKSTTPNARLKFMKLDLSSFTSTRKFVLEFKSVESRLDILVNNAGIMSCPESMTADGHEIHFQVNYLSHFLLTYLLLDILKSTPDSRIINNTAHAYKLTDFDHVGLINVTTPDVNSNTSYIHCNGNLLDSKAEDSETGQEKTDRQSNADMPNGHLTDAIQSGSHFTPTIDPTKTDQVTSGVAYAQSKLALILFTKKLATRFDVSPTVYVVNPGVVRTDLYKNMPFKKNPILAFTLAPLLWFFMKTPQDGAQTALYCATDPNLKASSGEYYCECNISRLESNALDEKKMDLLWMASLKACSL